MRTLVNPWFVAACIGWAIVFTLRRLGYPLPLINGYIDDLFALPVIANLGLWFQRCFIIKTNYYVLAPSHVIFIVIYVALIFEWLLPHLSKSYTADWMDVLLYAVGGLFFYLVMNKPAGMEIRDSR